MMEPQPSRGEERSPDVDGLASYAGRWIAYLGGRILAQGGTPAQALAAAKAIRYKEVPQILYVPTIQAMNFSEILERVANVLPADLPVYLVGGAVRDVLLGRPTHDLDFVLSGDVLKVARKAANRLEGAYYPMDEERQTARVILSSPDGSQDILDFAALRGPDLESDLKARDFTINAMAVDIQRPTELLDPLGGAADLRARRLRACSETSFSSDPLRILRAIRLAAAFSLHIMPEARSFMRHAVPSLPRVSPERMRDELFRMLDGPEPATCMRAMELIGALVYVLPELEGLKGVKQSPPHVSDAWAHTLDVVQKLDSMLLALGPQYNPDSAASLALGLAVLQLGRYRVQIGEHFRRRLNPDRSLRSLDLLAGLYHDIGKPQTSQIDERGRIHFYQHDQVGAQIAKERGEALRLSNVECSRLESIVRYHLRPMLLSNTGKTPSRKAIYRFFRDTGEAGVDICLLSLADFLATYGPTLPTEAWSHHLEVIRLLLSAWWETPEETVSPPAILNGNELIEELHLKPGPEVGRLLAAIREGQATGQVHNREEALALARQVLDKREDDEEALI